MKNSYIDKICLVSGSFKAFLILSTLVFSSVIASADDEIRYVSDVLIINLKTSVEAPFKVVTTLYSNDRLELLEIDGRFSKVRTEEGQEGWIASQYLTNKTPKTVIIEELRSQLEAVSAAEKDTFSSPEMIRELESLKQLNEDLLESNSTLVTENESLSELISSLQKQVDTLSATDLQENIPAKTQELISQLQAENKLLLKQVEELSIKNLGLQSSVVGITSDKNIDELKKKFTALLQENSGLKSKIKNLEIERMIYWFIAGAIVFLAGMISGKIFGKKTRKLGY